MKKVIVVVGLFFLIPFVLLEGRPAVAAEEVVVIIGGWGSDKNPEELGYLQKSILGSVAIVPSRYWPLEEAAADVLRQLQEKGARDNLILIGHSWGGLIAREIDAENPGLASKVITIGTPNRGFWFAPRFVCEVRDGKTLTPLYVVAGDVGGSGTDGVVSVVSALGAKKAEDAKIFPLGHVELMRSKEVLTQIQLWIK